MKTLIILESLCTVKPSHVFFYWLLLQVDLGGRKIVTGIATQGKVDLFVNAWTTFLEVWFSEDENTWYEGFNGQVISVMWK